MTTRAELTAADFDPAMAHLKDLARQQLTDARVTAAEQAIGIAKRLRAAA